MLMPDNILFFVCDHTKQPEKAVNVLQLATTNDQKLIF